MSHQASMNTREARAATASEVTVGQAANILRSTIKAGLPTLLVGRPGIGKTAIVHQVAEALGYDALVWYAAESDPTDVKGMPAIIDGEARFVVFSDLKALLDAQRPTVAFFDEIGHAPRSVQSAIMHILGARTICGTRLPDHVAFVGATNGLQDQAGVERMLEPLKDRWAVVLHVRQDLDEWKKWAAAHSIDDRVIAFIMWRPHYLSCWEPSLGFRKQPTARGFEYVSRLLSSGIANDVMYQVVEGIVGEGAAAEFMAFLNLYGSLPDVDYCIGHPNTCDVPSVEDDHGLAILYAFAAAVASRARPSNANSIWTLCQRLPRDVVVLMWTLIVERNPSMCATPAFINGFCKAFSDVLKEVRDGN